MDSLKTGAVFSEEITIHLCAFPLAHIPEGYSFPLVSIDGKQIFAMATQRRGELVRYDAKLREFVPFLGRNLGNLGKFYEIRKLSCLH